MAINANLTYGTPAIKQVLASKDKGSFGNKINCVGEQTKNCISTAAKGALVGTAIGVGTQAAMNSKTINKIADKGVQALKNNKTIQNIAEIGAEVLKGGVEAFKKLPASTKLIGAVGVGISLIATHVLNQQHAFRAGQIDQEYTDKAKFENLIG